MKKPATTIRMSRARERVEGKHVLYSEVDKGGSSMELPRGLVAEVFTSPSFSHFQIGEEGFYGKVLVFHFANLPHLPAGSCVLVAILSPVEANPHIKALCERSRVKEPKSP